MKNVVWFEWLSNHPLAFLIPLGIFIIVVIVLLILFLIQTRRK